jgi:hypothetical protein
MSNSAEMRPWRVRGVLRYPDTPISRYPDTPIPRRLIFEDGIDSGFIADQLEYTQ